MRQAHGPMSHKIFTFKQDSAIPLNHKHTFFWGIFGHNFNQSNIQNTYYLSTYYYNLK